MRNPDLWPAIPTALTTLEGRVLQGLAWGRSVYEAGALLGFSTVMLASTAEHVRSVDLHDGYPAEAPRPTWGPYLHNLEQYGVRQRVTPVRANYLDDLEGTDRQWDLAFADLTGDYQITKDFLVLTRSVPLVALHDYQRNHCQGATEALDEYVRIHQPRVVSRFDSLVVVENRS